jgi:hypothetical protein
MRGPKETAVMILGNGGPGAMAEEDYEMELGEDELEEDMESEYSDEQHEMAEELMAAVVDGNSQGVLEAIHGIYDSY